MKSIIASTLAFIATVSAAPAALPQSGSSYPVILKPQSYSQYYVSSGRVAWDSHTGRVYKSNSTESDVSTLVTFNIDHIYAGRTCSFQFEANGPEAFVYGKGQFDIFTSLEPATASAPAWPQGNLRDHHAGRMVVDSNTKLGSYVDGFPNVAKEFPCPTGILPGELVGAGDTVDIYWTDYNSSKGAYLLIR